MAITNPLWYPTKEQEILLKIALASNTSEAQAYWEKWSSKNSISHLQSESYLLFRSAISNLLAQGISLPEKLKNVARNTAVRNLVAIRDEQQIAGELTKHKIPLYALKGLALYAGGIYPRIDTRAMYDIDLYVSGKYYKKALNILLSAGWTKSAEYDHSAVLVRKGFPGELDFHCNPVWFQLTPKVIARMEKDTETIMFEGSPLRIMKPELQLAHILIHGARCGVNDYSTIITPHMRWIIDAHYLMKNKKINWQCFLVWVQTFEAVIQVKDALELLQRHFNINVPPHVISKLKTMPKTRTQKLHARYAMAYNSPKFFKIPRSLRASFHAWLLLHRTPTYINALTFKSYTGEFASFLQEGFLLDKNQSISSFILKKILSKPRLLFP